MSSPSQAETDWSFRPNWTQAEIEEWAALLPTFKTGPQDPTGRHVVWDLEGNGLLRKEGSKSRMDTLWCIGAMDVATKEKFYWGVDTGNLEDGLRFIAGVDRALAHNGIGFDYQVLEELYPWWKRPKEAWDTMVVAKLIWPADALVGPDSVRINNGSLPRRLYKSHSLEAWGYRLGTFKTDYSGGFEQWRPSMASYMMAGDLDVPDALWTLAQKRMGWIEPEKAPLVWPALTLEVEHEVARIIKRQELHGVHFDYAKARDLSKELLNHKQEIEQRLVETFGSWWQPECDPKRGIASGRTVRYALPQFPDVTLKRVSEKTGKELKPYVGPPLLEYGEGDLHVPITRVTYDPASRDHLGQRLQAVFGWRPKAFGKDGKPTVDEATLEEIPEAVLPSETRNLILDYFAVSKLYGMLTRGAKSWITLCNAHGEKHGTVNRLHGRMDTCGAVTRRGTHSDPNLSQVPGVRKEKLPDGTEAILMGLKGRYGHECRSLFIADEGWEQTGPDASSLELIILGHYLYPLDGGAFSERVCDPSRDPHKEHADIAGMTRAQAKTTIYLKVYGGSAFKLSLDLDISEEEVPSYLTYKGLPMLLKALERRFDAKFVRDLDDRQRAKIAKARTIIVKLEEGITGLADLIASVQAAAEKGWLKAIDGSRIHVRKPHAALNSLLQSAGAISCKLWIVLVHRLLEKRGLVYGKDYKQVLWIHDELQFTHRPGLGPLIRECAEEAMVEAGIMLGLRGRYRTDAKSGKNWAECH